MYCLKFKSLYLLNAPSIWSLIDEFFRGFNEALNGFTDEGWSVMGNDGMDDVTILVNSSPDKLMGLNLSFTNGFPSVSNAVLCAKASMLLQVRIQTLFHSLFFFLDLRLCSS